MAAAAVAILAGCSTYDSITQRIAQSITPYRITIVQGNFVSAEQAAQMRVGMSRDDVRKLLGTPLLTDMFHANRWDYLFYFKRGNTSVVQQRDFVVHFNGDSVVSWSGGENLPSNLELLAEIDGDKTGKKAVPPPAASAAAVASAPQEASSAPEAAAASVGAPSMDPNARAARAANRATAEVAAPASDATPSVRAGTPPAGGVPAEGSTTGQPQFKFTRPPATPSPDQQQENPVGPTGSQSNLGPTYNAPLTSSSSSSNSGS